MRCVAMATASIYLCIDFYAVTNTSTRVSLVLFSFSFKSVGVFFTFVFFSCFYFVSFLPALLRDFYFLLIFCPPRLFGLNVPLCAISTPPPPPLTTSMMTSLPPPPSPRIKEDHVIQHGLVVDGGSLSLALREHEKLFMDVCKKCSAVLCCRMAPLQKAKVEPPPPTTRELGPLIPSLSH